MDNISCTIIKDLLPSYADGLASETTKVIVEEHLAGCVQCRYALEAIRAEKVFRKDNDMKELEYLRKIRRENRRSYAIGAVVALLFLTAFVIWSHWMTYPIRPDLSNAGYYALSTLIVDDSSIYAVDLDKNGKVHGKVAIGEHEYLICERYGQLAIRGIERDFTGWYRLSTDIFDIASTFIPQIFGSADEKYLVVSGFNREHEIVGIDVMFEDGAEYHFEVPDEEVIMLVAPVGDMKTEGDAMYNMYRWPSSIITGEEIDDKETETEAETLRINDFGEWPVTSVWLRITGKNGEDLTDKYISNIKDFPIEEDLSNLDTELSKYFARSPIKSEYESITILDTFKHGHKACALYRADDTFGLAMLRSCRNRRYTISFVNSGKSEEISCTEENATSWDKEDGKRYFTVFGSAVCPDEAVKVRITYPYIDGEAIKEKTYEVEIPKDHPKGAFVVVFETDEYMGRTIPEVVEYMTD